MLGVFPQFLNIEDEYLFGYCEQVPEERRRDICYRAAFQWNETRHFIDGDTMRMCGKNTACAARYEEFKNVEGLPDYRYGLFGRR